LSPSGTGYTNELSSLVPHLSSLTFLGVTYILIYRVVTSPEYSPNELEALLVGTLESILIVTSSGSGFFKAPWTPSLI